jgi:GNAT superfamily N-acetyltransferase
MLFREQGRGIMAKFQEDRMITYRIGTEDIDWQALTDIYCAVGLVGGFGDAGDREGIRRAFEGSWRVVTAWDGDKLVGGCRMLSDGVCNAMVFDMGVNEDYRRRGIATGIMKKLLEGCEDFYIYITARFGVEKLYRQFGFKKHRNAYGRYPVPSEYLED